jgi:hypothetical protein
MTNDNEMLTDRNPNLEIDANSEESQKQLANMMDFISKMDRKQKRKVFKPTYSRGVRNAFRSASFNK